MRHHPYRTLAIALLALVAVSLSTASASAVELKYQWRKGKSYSFNAKTVQTVDAAVAGMEVKSKFSIDAVYTIHVDRVDSSGTAHGALAIDRFSVKSSDGRQIANLSNLPSKAVVNRLQIDKKGRFLFKEIVYLLVPQQGDAVLASTSVGPNGVAASASGRIGREEHTIYARFDAKTGRLSAGYKVRKLRRKKAKVPHLSAATKVDVVPFELLTMLELPVGPVVAGTKARMKAGGFEVVATVKNASANAARVNTVVSTPKTKGIGAEVKTPGGGTEMKTPDMPDIDDTMGDGMGNSGMGGGGVGNRGMGGGGGMGNRGMRGGGGMGNRGMRGGGRMGRGAPGASPLMQVEGDFTQDFNVTKGMLKRIQGWVVTTINVPMARIKSHATVTLTPVP